MDIFFKLYFVIEHFDEFYEFSTKLKKSTEFEKRVIVKS